MFLAEKEISDTQTGLREEKMAQLSPEHQDTKTRLFINLPLNDSLTVYLDLLLNAGNEAKNNGFCLSASSLAMVITNDCF